MDEYKSTNNINDGENKTITIKEALVAKYTDFKNSLDDFLEKDVSDCLFIPVEEFEPKINDHIRSFCDLFEDTTDYKLKYKWILFMQGVELEKNKSEACYLIVEKYINDVKFILGIE
jgi:hypothetical protein